MEKWTKRKKKKVEKRTIINARKFTRRQIVIRVTHDKC